MPRPSKALAAPAEKDLYLFLAEADAKKGIHENHVHVITKLVSDKVFSESSDLVCISTLENNDFHFEVPSWDMLRNFNDTSPVPAECAFSNGSQFVDSILQACEIVSSHALEDSFSNIKILVFANFTDYVIEVDKLAELKQKVETYNILLTLVFPVEVEAMSRFQKTNFEQLKKPPITPSPYVYIHTYKSCLGRILNIVANKPKRSMPWKVVLEIGSGIEIPVKKLIINRKNPVTLKSRVEKATKDLDGTPSGNKKEIAWIENDGTSIDQSEVGNAYSYGDKLVTIADETTYETGDACLKLLVFCPRENILPVYLVGSGTDIVFPQDGDEVAAVKFDALFKALVNTQTVAVVKKVQRKNAKLALAVLSPDIERQGLIFTELCFADDISIPHFPHLIKETSSEEDGITEKDALIDELISLKSMDDFNPAYGPVDSKTRIFRDHVTQKIVNGEGKPKIQDNVELYFNQINFTDDMLAKLQNQFPLAIKKEAASDRPSGMQVFRKRVKNDAPTNGSDKKVKIDEVAVMKEEKEDEVEDQEPQQDIDDMLDDL